MKKNENFMNSATAEISDLDYIEMYKHLIKNYEMLTQELIEILKQIKTDCCEQTVEEVTKELAAFCEYQNSQKANRDTVLKH